MLTIVIPALNEAGTIGAVVQEALSATSGPLEVLVVDDGSSDSTGNEAQAAGARLVRHAAPKGYGRALKTGIEQASFPVIAICDADGTYPLDHLASLLEALQSGAHMAVGARWGHHYRGALFMRILRWGLALLFLLASGRRVPDVNSGLRVFQRAHILPLLPLLSDGFSFTTSVTLSYLLCDRSVVYCAIPYRRRRSPSKVRLARDILRTVVSIVRPLRALRPLRFWALVSTALVLVVDLVLVLVLVSSIF